MKISSTFTLNPLPDETLSSLIIRYALVEFGMVSSTQLKGVISNSGSWTPFPILSDGLKPFFKELSTGDLDKLIMERSPTVSKNHIAYADLLRNYLFGESELYYWEIDAISTWPDDIRYCPICIEQQKREFGVSYFKHQWHGDYYCKLHNIHLQRLVESRDICRCKQRGKGTAIFHKVESIMSGVCRYCSKPVEPTDSSKELPYFSQKTFNKLRQKNTQ